MTDINLLIAHQVEQYFTGRRLEQAAQDNQTTDENTGR